jgi:hypothetical protein
MNINTEQHNTTEPAFGVSPSSSSVTTPSVTATQTTTPTIPIKMTFRGHMKTTTLANAAQSATLKLGTGTNVSDLLSDNEVGVDIEPVTSGNKVYVCSCCVDTSVCKIM